VGRRGLETVSLGAETVRGRRGGIPTSDPFDHLQPRKEMRGTKRTGAKKRRNGGRAVSEGPNARRVRGKEAARKQGRQEKEAGEQKRPSDPGQVSGTDRGDRKPSKIQEQGERRGKGGGTPRGPLIDREPEGTHRGSWRINTQKSSGSVVGGPEVTPSAVFAFEYRIK